MRPRFAYHVLSHDGTQYRTTRTGGVSPAEARALEQFFFGQTNDPAYFAGLEHEPGLMWRQVGSTKALTRVRPGKPDSNGRATLRFETVLLTPNLALASDQAPRLVCGEWNFFDDRVEVTPAATTTGKLHPQRISDVLMNLDGAARIVRQAAGFSLADVAKIIAQRASDPEFSLAYKSLNAQAPVTVNLVSGAVSESTMATTRPKQNREAQARQRGLPAYREPGSARASPLVVVLLIAVIGLQILSFFSARVSQPSGDLDEVQKALITRIENVRDKVEMLRDEFTTTVESEVQGLQTDFRDELVNSESRINTAIAKATERTDTLRNTMERLIANLDEHLASSREHVMSSLVELSAEVGNIGAENRKGFKNLAEGILEIKGSVGKLLPQDGESKQPSENQE